MTTADMSLVAKESTLVEKVKKNMQSHFFFVQYCTINPNNTEEGN